MTRINDDEFEEASTTIAQDIENTLERVVNDYSQHWKGVLGEWIQNSYDGWCHNRFGRRTIPTDQPLRIHFEADLAKRLFKAGDNAGGMPEETFYYNFAGLDTPGEEKQSGDFGGSYGRGSHVIAGLGEEMYAETHYHRFRGGLDVRGARQMRTAAELEINDQGTFVEVHDCDIDTLTKLTEWDRVRRYIQARFHPLLQHDNITIQYTIGSETHTVEPLDFDPFDVLWEGELTFEHAGDEYMLRDIRIYDATTGDADIPIGGLSMLKSNTHMDRPFMRVQDYKPRQLRHLDKMFGVCDASELCPEYEDNAHNSFTGSIVSHTGLKPLLEEIEREHFIGTPTDLDAKDEIVDTTLEVVNNQWEHNPFGQGDYDANSDLPDEEEPDDEDEPADEPDRPTEPTETETEPDVDSDPEELDEADDLDEPDDDNETDIDDLDLDWAGDHEDEDTADNDESPDEDSDENEFDPLPDVSCSTRSRSYAADSDVDVWVFVENPAEYDHSEFTVEAELEHAETGERIEVSDKEFTVPPGQGTSGEHSWTVTPEETGKYLFRAYLHDEETPERDRVDTTNTWFWMGRDTTEEEEEVDTVSFLEDVVLIRDDDEDFRAELNEGDRGMILVANTRHPEYRHAVRLDGRSGTKNQKLTLIRWAHESIMTRLLLDQLDEELADMYSTDGEPLAEELGGFVRENMIEQMSRLMAGAHGEV